MLIRDINVPQQKQFQKKQNLILKKEKNNNKNIKIKTKTIFIVTNLKQKETIIFVAIYYSFESESNFKKY